jgi:myo-inositol 2-dehydrogenase/D-chiro-inositol 1-dehydrogenase
MLRVGVIGAGVMGADHVLTLDRFISGAGVQAVADVDLSLAQLAVATLRDTASTRRTGRSGAVIGTGPVIGTGTEPTATSDPLALIADPAVDAVLIASDDGTHAEFIQASVAAGKPVLCEKPLAPTLEQSLYLREVVGDRADLVSLGFMRRFDPGYTRLKTAINARALGHVLLVHCVSRGVRAAASITNEGHLNSSAVHDFDVVPWLIGSPVVEVSWQAPRPSSLAGDLQDPQLILLRTADGVLTSCETFRNAGYGYDIRCEVVGETGAMSLVEPATVVNDWTGARRLTYGIDWRPRFADAYRLELQAWVDLLRFGARHGTRSALAGLEDGVRASAVAQAVVESMHDDGRLTKVSQLKDRETG